MKTLRNKIAKELVKIAKELVAADAEWDEGAKVKQVLTKYKARKEGNNWEVEFEDSYRAETDWGKQKVSFSITIEISKNGNSVVMELSDYYDQGGMEFEPEIEEEKFAFTNDADAARKIDAYLANAKKTLRQLCRYING